MSVTQIEHYFPVSVPLTPLSTFMGRWVFGEALCKLLPASQVDTMMVTRMMMIMVDVMVVVVVLVVETLCKLLLAS